MTEKQQDDLIKLKQVVLAEIHPLMRHEYQVDLIEEVFLLTKYNLQKSIAWFEAANPFFGAKSVIAMLQSGKGLRVAQFINEMSEEVE